MDLHHLEQFLAVAEAGSFTRAAGKLGRTQPAVSQSIKRLEEEIGSLLFARDLHDVTLTESGKRLAEYARRMLRLRDEAMESIGEVQNLSAGRLSIAAHEAAALYLLPPLLQGFLRQFPDIRIGVYRSPLDEVQRQVLYRQVDLGFVSHDAAFKELETVHVCSDAMVLVASPRHPLRQRAGLRVEDLGDQRFVLHHGCTSTAAKITRLFEEHRTPFRICAELWSFENIKDFVQQDVGISIVPRVTVSRELATGALVEIPIEGLDIPRRTYVIFRDRRYLSDSARGFLQIISKFDWKATMPESTNVAMSGDLQLLGR
jgi:DNA-binding transcriptional LysR family regulator